MELYGAVEAVGTFRSTWSLCSPRRDNNPPDSVKEASQGENCGSLSKLWNLMEKPPKITCHILPQCQDLSISVSRPLRRCTVNRKCSLHGKMGNTTFRRMAKIPAFVMSVLFVMQTCGAQCSSVRVFTTTLPVLWNAKYGFQLGNLITGVTKVQKLILEWWNSRAKVAFTGPWYEFKKVNNFFWIFLWNSFC